MRADGTISNAKDDLSLDLSDLPQTHFFLSTMLRRHSLGVTSLMVLNF